MFRRRWVAVVAVAGVLMIALSWPAYRYLTVQQTDEIPVPGDSVGPDEVVRVYLDALDAHDCDTAQVLYPYDSMCDDVESAEVGEVNVNFISTKSGLERALVNVIVDIGWRPFYGLFGDVSDTGPGWRSYHLERPGAGDAWRITGEEGMG